MIRSRPGDKRNRPRNPQPDKREADGRYKAGVSGNPGGRPADTFRLGEKARQFADECLEFLMRVVRKEEEGVSNGDRIRAAQEVLNRGLGRPAQQVNVMGVEGGDNALRIIVEHVKANDTSGGHSDTDS